MVDCTEMILDIGWEMGLVEFRVLWETEIQLWVGSKKSDFVFG